MAEETPGLLYSLPAALDRGSAQRGRARKEEKWGGNDEALPDPQVRPDIHCTRGSLVNCMY